MENVLPYRNTASIAIAQTVLSKLGHVVQETGLHGPQFGALERRARLCLVAAHPSFDLSRIFDLAEFEESAPILGAVLDDLPPEDSA